MHRLYIQTNHREKRQTQCTDTQTIHTHIETDRDNTHSHTKTHTQCTHYTTTPNATQHTHTWNNTYTHSHLERSTDFFFPVIPAQTLSIYWVPKWETHIHSVQVFWVLSHEVIWPIFLSLAVQQIIRMNLRCPSKIFALAGINMIDKICKDFCQSSSKKNSCAYFVFSSSSALYYSFI